MNNNTIIRLENINLISNKNTVLENQILKNISLNVYNGEFITLIGSNGAGKTSLMKVIAGTIFPDSGKIFIDNFDVTNWDCTKRANLISRVFQNPLLGSCAELSIEENLTISLMRYQTSLSLRPAIHKERRSEFKEKLYQLGLGLENRMHEPMRNLSGGQRQAVSLIMATMCPCKILLLDEHTSALDPKMADIVLDLTQKIVMQYNLTTLMITHSMKQALLFGGRTLLLHKGQILYDITGERRQNLNPSQLLELFRDFSLL